MILVERADNGYLVYERNLDDDGWHRPLVIASGEDEVDAQVRTLWAVVELMGWNASQRDEWVVSIAKDHGHKWVSPEELLTEVRG